MFTAALLTTAKIWKHPKCWSSDNWIKKLLYKNAWSILNLVGERRMIDLNDISRTLCPKTQYTFFFKCMWNILRIGHILGHKSSFGNYKKIEIASSIFFLTTMLCKLDITTGKKKTIKMDKHWGLNNMILCSQEVNAEMKEEIKNIDTNDNKSE